MTRPPVSDEARGYRIGMWLLLGVAAVNLLVAFRGIRGGLPPATGAIAAVSFLFCIIVAGWLGLKGARRAREDREMQSRRDMIVLLAVQLGKQDDETLERVAGKGGSAGEAARLILQGRKEKREQGTGGGARA